MRRGVSVGNGWRACLVLVVVMAAAACTNIKHGLYNMAIDHERGKADLVYRQIAWEGKPVALLESEEPDEKEVFVMLHGFSANKDNWVRFAGHLTDTFHVVALDLPGHGDSFYDPDMPYDIDDQVQYLHGIFHILNIDTFHLAGNSMGGAISALYAATYPGQVRSLMLFAPGGIYDYESELHRQLKAGNNPLIVKDTSDYDRLMNFALEKKPFIPWPITSVLAEKAFARKAINEKIFKDIRDSHGYDFKAALEKITAPTKIIWGVEDRVLAVENAAVFEQLIPGADKELLEGIGHVPMVEVPEQTADMCRAFITSVEQ